MLSKPGSLSDETPGDTRARVLREQAEQRERRQQDLRDQASTEFDAPTRIRMWERLHHARLPRDPQHKLVPVIAAGTHLSAEEIHAEQRRRFEPPAA